MKLTNAYGLPQAFLDAITAKPYVKRSTLSVTELCDPLQKTILTHRHYDEIEEDAIDRVWALLGSAAHEILSRSMEGAHLVEERLFATFCTDVGWVTVSGQPDRIDLDQRIRDFKVISAWTIVYGSRTPEWVKQLSYYRVLGKIATDIDILDQAEIVAIIRDFDKHQAGRGGYPELPVCVIPIELMPIDAAYAAMQEYCAQYLTLQQLPDASLPPCTPEERWTQPTRFALFTNSTNKRALRTYTNEGEAQAALADLKAEVNAKGKVKNPDAYLEVRQGGPRRCEEYCAVAPFCSQYQGELKAKGGQDAPQTEAATASEA